MNLYGEDKTTNIMNCSSADQAIGRIDIDKEILTLAFGSMTPVGLGLHATLFVEGTEKKQLKSKKKTSRMGRLAVVVASCCSTIQDFHPLSAAQWSSETLYSWSRTLYLLHSLAPRLYRPQFFFSKHLFPETLMSIYDASVPLPLFMGLAGWADHRFHGDSITWCWELFVLFIQSFAVFYYCHSPLTLSLSSSSLLSPPHPFFLFPPFTRFFLLLLYHKVMKESWGQCLLAKRSDIGGTIRS